MAIEIDELREHMEGAASFFDRGVAVTMAIVAAALATITMLGHRAHNETLLIHADSNRLEVEANILHTQASDQWNFFQAKNSRNYQFQSFLGLTSMLRAGVKNPADSSSRLVKEWTAQVEKYERELPALEAKAEQLAKEGRETQERARRSLEESNKAHERANRYDLAELAVELSLVLCSLAILTKLRPFWFTGIFMGVVGAVVAGSALMT